MNWYLKCVNQYADFRGRARRKEYWMFILWNIVIASALGAFMMVTMAFDEYADSTLSSIPLGISFFLYILYALFIFIPSLAVCVRRLHDIGKSGWWLLIDVIPVIGPIILLVWYCTEGQRCENEWGPDPKEGE